MKSKINFIGFILCLVSFIYESPINDLSNTIYSEYSPDCGQYIVLDLGLALSFFRTNNFAQSLLSVLFSFRFCDELFIDDNVINFSDFVEIIVIFVIGYFNFKETINGEDN